MSVSAGTRAREWFLAASNRQGDMISCRTVTPQSANFSTVLSSLPVSRTQMQSASIMEDTQRSTNFSSFFAIAYMQTFILCPP